MSHVFFGFLQHKLFRKTKGRQIKSQGCTFFERLFSLFWVTFLLTWFTFYFFSRGRYTHVLRTDCTVFTHLVYCFLEGIAIFCNFLKLFECLFYWLGSHFASFLGRKTFQRLFMQILPRISAHYANIFYALNIWSHVT